MTQRQPNSLHCFVCGVANPIGLNLRFDETGAGEVEALVTVPEKYQGYNGVVHGGIVAAMLDEIAGRAYMGEDPPRFMFTGRLDIRYRKNVPVGQPLRLVGKAVRSKPHAAVACSWLYDSDGNVLAEAEALLVDVPEGTVDMNNLEAFGWRVYED